MNTRFHFLGTLLVCLLAGCSSDPVGQPGVPKLSIQTDNMETPTAFLVTVSQLPDGHTVHARVRAGKAGVLDCSKQLNELERIDERVVSQGAQGIVLRGPVAQADYFQTPYNDAWLQGEPTPR